MRGSAPDRADGFASDRDRGDEGVANHLPKHGVAGSRSHLPGPDAACALGVEEGLFDRVRGEDAGRWRRRPRLRWCGRACSIICRSWDG